MKVKVEAAAIGEEGVARRCWYRGVGYNLLRLFGFPGGAVKTVLKTQKYF